MRKLFCSIIITIATIQTMVAASVGVKALTGVANAAPATRPSLSNDSKPDCTVWGGADGKPERKYFYKYDANRNKIQEINYIYNNAGSLYQADSTRYTYDANGNNTGYEGYYHLASSNQWRGSGKQDYTYDKDNVKTGYINYRWTDDVWVPEYKEEYAFDDHKNKTIHSYLRWNTTDNIWVEYLKYDYTYNSGDMCTGYVATSCSDNVWSNSMEYEATYDDNNNLIFQANYSWTDGAWVVTGKNEATYDDNSNMLTNVSYTLYNGKEIRTKYVYTYDDRGYKTGLMEYEWSNDAWSESFKHEYTSDDHGNEISVSNYIPDSGGWYPYSRKEYEYNDNDVQISASELSWSPADNKWYYHDKWKYTFDEDGCKTGYIKYLFYGSEVDSHFYYAFTSEELENHPYYKDEYTFDENHNVISENKYDWSYYGVWDLDSYVNYYYNSPSAIQFVSVEKNTDARVRTVMENGRLIIIDSHDRRYDIVGKQLK